MDQNLIVFEDNQDDLVSPEMKVTVFTETIFHSGDYLTGTYTPGIYIVEVRAWT